MLKRKMFKNISIGISIILFVLIINVFPYGKHNEDLYITTFNNKGYIYMLDNNNYVSKISVNFKSRNNDELILEIIDMLTINKNKIRDGFKAIIPENTKLLNFYMEDDILYLNFNEIIKNINPKLERKMFECITFSMLEIKNIKNIILLINNKEYSGLLNKEMGINKETNINSFDDVSSTTIFYLAKYDDFIYYIPVTKYTNNNEKKINIIIDELKSSTTYNTNLVNYLNEYTTLVSSDVTDSQVILNFSNINKNDLNEEVKYAINNSIYYNYDIKSVFYYIDDNIVDNYFLDLG